MEPLEEELERAWRVVEYLKDRVRPLQARLSELQQQDDQKAEFDRLVQCHKEARPRDRLPMICLLARHFFYEMRSVKPYGVRKYGKHVQVGKPKVAGGREWEVALYITEDGDVFEPGSRHRIMANLIREPEVLVCRRTPHCIIWGYYRPLE